MYNDDGKPIPDLGIGDINFIHLRPDAVASCEDIVNWVRAKKCCTMHLIGHCGAFDDHGAPVNPGGISSYPPPDNERVTILPDPTCESSLRSAFEANCTDCVINIVTCSGPSYPGRKEVRKQIANRTGCTVCGSTDFVPINDNEKPLDPCKSNAYNPWQYECEEPDKDKRLKYR